MSEKKCQARASSKSVLQECLTRVSSKKFQVRVSRKLTSKSVLQECQGGVGCQVKVSYKSVLQRVSSKKCQVRVSSKKCLTRVSSKSVLQECQVRVSHTSVK